MTVVANAGLNVGRAVSASARAAPVGIATSSNGRALWPRTGSRPNHLRRYQNRTRRIPAASSYYSSTNPVVSLPFALFHLGYSLDPISFLVISFILRLVSLSPAARVRDGRPATEHSTTGGLPSESSRPPSGDAKRDDRSHSRRNIVFY